MVSRTFREALWKLEETESGTCLVHTRRTRTHTNVRCTEHSKEDVSSEFSRIFYLRATELFSLELKSFERGVM